MPMKLTFFSRTLPWNVSSETSHPPTERWENKNNQNEFGEARSMGDSIHFSDLLKNEIWINQPSYRSISGTWEIVDLNLFSIPTWRVTAIHSNLSPLAEQQDFGRRVLVRIRSIRGKSWSTLPGLFWGNHQVRSCWRQGLQHTFDHDRDSRVMWSIRRKTKSSPLLVSFDTFETIYEEWVLVILPDSQSWITMQSFRCLVRSCFTLPSFTQIEQSKDVRTSRPMASLCPTT